MAISLTHRADRGKCCGKKLSLQTARLGDKVNHERGPASFPASSWKMPMRRATHELVAQCLLLACLFTAYHVALRWLMLHTGLQLGAVRPSEKVYRLVPLYAYWDPHFKTGIFVAVGVVALVLSCLWWLVQNTRVPAAVVVAALMIAHLLIATSVAMIDGGPRRLWRPYELLTGTDYIGAVASVESPREFLRAYPRLMPELPMHCQTHPPGGVLFLWTIARLFGAGPVPAAWATILASALVVPAVFCLARDVLDEPAARLAATLIIVSPSIVLFSATLLDAVFAVPIVWSICFLWKARDSRPLVYGALAGGAGAIAAMMTFSASFLGLWAVAVFVLTALAKRGRLRNTLLALASAAATVAAFYTGLYAWSGYDPLATLVEAMAGQQRIMAGRGHDSLRQDLHFALANMAAFLFCAGLPLAALWMRRVVLLVRDAEASRDGLFTASFVLALAIFDAAPLYTLEVEHIWLFLVPFICIGAASVAKRDEPAVARVTLVLLAVQTMLMEVLLETTW
jgi:hypothetical protein